MEDLKKLYEKNIDYGLRFLIATEKKLKEEYTDMVLPIEENTTIITEVMGKLVKYVVDRISYKSFCVTDGGCVELHVCKKNKQKADLWVTAQSLYGSRLDLVYRNIIWKVNSVYTKEYDAKKEYIVTNFDVLKADWLNENFFYDFVTAIYDYLDSLTNENIKGWSNSLTLAGFYRFLKKNSEKYIELD